MLAPLARRARRERRLLLLVTGLAFLAGVLLYARLPTDSVTGLPVPLLTGMIYACVIGPAAFVTCMILPALRAMIEAVAISRFLVSLAAFGMPDFAFALVSNPFLMAALTVSGGAIISRGRRSWRARVATA